MTSEKRQTYIYEEGSITSKENLKHHMNDLGFSIDETDNEKTQWNATETFKLNIHQDTLDESTNFPLHSHSFLEIIQYKDPVEIEALIAGRRYSIQSNDIICLNAGTIHKILLSKDSTPCHRNVIVGGPELLQQIPWPENYPGFFIVRPNSDLRHKIRDLMNFIYEQNESDSIYSEIIIENSLHLLIAMLFNNAENDIQAEKSSLLEEVIAYIEKHIEEPITLQQASKDLYVSEKTINREFKKFLDTTFHQYLNSYRLLQALNLLQSGVSLHEVSDQVGFTDYATFFRAFKKQFGCSPKDMKANY